MVLLGVFDGFPGVFWWFSQGLFGGFPRVFLMVLLRVFDRVF